MDKQQDNKNIGLIEVDGIIYPQTIGKPYNLIPGEVYKITVLIENSGHTKVVIRLAGPLALPDKIIHTKADKEFINRVIRSHKTSTRPTTGVMLFGVKGSGKTVMAKEIAEESGLPIIIIDDTISFSDIANFFQSIGGDVCLLCDEFDKRGTSQGMLDFLDGLEYGLRKLIIFTANNIEKLDRYLANRPSRIRYFKKFDKTSKFLSENIVKNENIDDKYGILRKFIEDNFDLQTIDIVKSFIEEVKIFGGTDITPKTLYYIAKEMNIELKGQNKFRDVEETTTANTHLNMLLEIVEGIELSEYGKTQIEKQIEGVRNKMRDYNILSNFDFNPDENPYGELESDEDDMYYDDGYDD